MSKESKQVIVYPRGQLSANDRRNLLANGFLPVEADDPKAVVTVLPSAPVALDGNDVLMAALWGLGQAYSQQDSSFRAEIYRRMAAREKGTKP